MPAKLVSRVDLFIQYAIASTEMALTDSGLPKSDLGDEVGVIIGVGMGGVGLVEHYTRVLDEKGYRRVTPFLFP